MQHWPCGSVACLEHPAVSTTTTTFSGHDVLIAMTSAAFVSLLITIFISSISTGKQTPVLGDFFCYVKITVCYRLDDHDFSSAGARGQAVLLLLLQSKVSQVQPWVSADLAGIPQPRGDERV